MRPDTAALAALSTALGCSAFGLACNEIPLSPSVSTTHSIASRCAAIESLSTNAPELWSSELKAEASPAFCTATVQSSSSEQSRTPSELPDQNDDEKSNGDKILDFLDSLSGQDIEELEELFQLLEKTSERFQAFNQALVDFVPLVQQFVTEAESLLALNGTQT